MSKNHCESTLAPGCACTRPAGFVSGAPCARRACPGRGSPHTARTRRSARTATPWHCPQSGTPARSCSRTSSRDHWAPGGRHGSGQRAMRVRGRRTACTRRTARRALPRGRRVCSGTTAAPRGTRTEGRTCSRHMIALGHSLRCCCPSQRRRQQPCQNLQEDVKFCKRPHRQEFFMPSFVRDLIIKRFLWQVC